MFLSENIQFWTKHHNMCFFYYDISANEYDLVGWTDKLYLNNVMSLSDVRYNRHSKFQNNVDFILNPANKKQIYPTFTSVNRDQVREENPPKIIPFFATFL